ADAIRATAADPRAAAARAAAARRRLEADYAAGPWLDRYETSTARSGEPAAVPPASPARRGGRDSPEIPSRCREETVSVAGVVIAAAIALAAYTYIGYPLILLALARTRGFRTARARPGPGPHLRRDATPRAYVAAGAGATTTSPQNTVADEPDAAWP